VRARSRPRLLLLWDDVGSDGDGRMGEKQAAEHLRASAASWEKAGHCRCCQGSAAAERTTLSSGITGTRQASAYLLTHKSAACRSRLLPQLIPAFDEP